jgi:UDP-N-acetylmuramoyl-L-alanyl-D-glutamate--2,6-diaminopimelate ligase
MLTALKRLIPAPLLGVYHRVLSFLAALRYGFPSEHMIVIGVTGTNGKTTVSYMLAKALEALGDPTGCTTTAMFKVGKKEWLNDRKMTMLGRFQLQKLLRDMKDAGCKYVVVETSSQGIIQHRHRAINYDVAVFTNLTPEHVEAHGGFENYKKAKIELFRHTVNGRRKTIGGKPVEKIAILNAGSEHAKDFAVDGFDRVVPIHLDGSVRRSASEISTCVDRSRRVRCSGRQRANVRFGAHRFFESVSRYSVDLFPEWKAVLRNRCGHEFDPANGNVASIPVHYHLCRPERCPG